MKTVISLLLVAGLCLIANTGFCEEEVIFGFEEGVSAWQMPDWSFEDEAYVGENVSVSEMFAKEGDTSLELTADFSGAKWTGVYVEIQESFNWTPYKGISADVFLPEDAPYGLKAKIILTVGEDWTWTEMARSVDLVPGQWTTIMADLLPGSYDWRKTQVTDGFRADVRKLGIRVESNLQPVYSGNIYIDNVRLEKSEEDTAYDPYSSPYDYTD